MRQNPPHCVQSPRRRQGTFAGAALADARRSKERTYPELVQSHRCQLVVLGIDVGGRFSHESARFLRLLATARARSVLTLLRSSAAAAFVSRWSAMLTVRPSGVPPRTLQGSRGLDLCPLQLAKFPLNAPKHTWRRVSIKTAQRTQGVPEPSLPKKARGEKKTGPIFSSTTWPKSTSSSSTASCPTSSSRSSSCNFMAILRDSMKPDHWPFGSVLLGNHRLALVLRCTPAWPTSTSLLFNALTTVPSKSSQLGCHCGMAPAGYRHISTPRWSHL